MSEIDLHFVIFGSTGNLAITKLIPALQKLSKENNLPEKTEIITVGRKSFDTEEYIDYIKQRNKSLNSKTLNDLNLSYMQVDFQDEDGFRPLFEHLDIHKSSYTIFYLSLGPEVVPIVIDRFCDKTSCHSIENNLAKIAIEKPFGTDINTAKNINNQLLRITREDQICRIDHYLHKHTVKNLSEYRLAAGYYGDFWDSVKEVEIVSAEENLVGERAGYYDKNGGAINDWLQNHLIQMLALSICEEDIENSPKARSEVLKTLKIIPSSLVVGQYEGYLDHNDVKSDSKTETLASIKIKSSLPHLKDISLKISSGKGLDEKMVAIKYRLKNGSLITIPIDPSNKDDVLGENRNDAYYNVIASLVLRESDLFISKEEIHEQWRIFENIDELKKDAIYIKYKKGTGIYELIPS